jgi:hypothetical protein
MGTRHDLAHMRLGGVTIHGDDLIADVGGGDNAILLVLLIQFDDNTVDISPPHQGHGIGNGGIRVNDNNGTAHPISNEVRHGFLQKLLLSTPSPGVEGFRQDDERSVCLFYNQFNRIHREQRAVFRADVLNLDADGRARQ